MSPNIPDIQVSSNDGQVEGGEEWRVPTVDFQTLVITETTRPEKFSSRPVAVPIVMSSTFEKSNVESILIASGNEEDNTGSTYMYGRYANPTRDIFEQALAKLEGVKHAVTFGSGTAAIAGVLDCLKAGDGVVAMRTVYGGTYQLLKTLDRSAIEVQFVSNFTPENVAKAVKENTKMVWLESPANPTLRVADIEKISQAAHAINENILVVIDNTFLTPVLQRPIELGADICVYSLTKYIGGHSDFIMGGVTTNSDELHKQIRANQLERGGVPSPFDCYLAIRSLKTLPIRLAAHSTTSLKVAQFLESHPNVEKVIHPGLKSHESHELARQQQYGHSGMLGFYVRGGYKESEAFLMSTKVVRRAPSLGGDTSLACIPSKMSHTQLSEEERNELAITDNYIRLSVGLESAAVIIEDINQALKIAFSQ